MAGAALHAFSIYAANSIAVELKTTTTSDITIKTIASLRGYAPTSFVDEFPESPIPLD